MMDQLTCVLGSGAMGIACSCLLSEHPGQRVKLWGRDTAHIAELVATRENSRLLPGVKIPAGIDLTADIEYAVSGADLLVVAIPSAYLREALTRLAPYIPRHVPVVSVVKGMENSTQYRPSQIISEVLGHDAVAVLGGPSHSEEICRRLPASVVVASADQTLARRVQGVFTTDRFRVYTNRDMVGVELAGALKNVVAIAAGISDGLGFGDNAKAALVTRAIVEMTRFGVLSGAEASTFSGLAGLGDLITTCISPYGRNRKVGERLGRGETLAQILQTMQSVAEGVPTSRSIYEYAQRQGIEMPISTEVYRVLFEDKPPREATTDLMVRPPRDE
jgi:glycerol-3-phosphate dehydrogenase (NAD(P)+)